MSDDSIFKAGMASAVLKNHETLWPLDRYTDSLQGASRSAPHDNGAWPGITFCRDCDRRRCRARDHVDRFQQGKGELLHSSERAKGYLVRLGQPCRIAPVGGLWLQTRSNCVSQLTAPAMTSRHVNHRFIDSSLLSPPTSRSSPGISWRWASCVPSLLAQPIH